MINKSYKYRLYPTKEQEQVLWQNIGACRWLYNRYVAHLNLGWTFFGLKHSENMDTLPTEKEMKEAHTWLAKADAKSLCYVKRNLKSAYSHLFRKKKLGEKTAVRFKSRHNPRQSFSLHNQSILDVTEKGIRLCKIGTVKMVRHREMEGRIVKGTISNHGGQWHVSITCEMETMPVTMPKTDKAIGIDMGLTSFLATSDEEKVENPKTLKRFEKKLAKKQRMLSRKIERAKRDKRDHSKRRDRQRLRVAKAHRRIACIRDDFLHKLSTRVISENQVIALENLKIANMVRNRRLSKAISDASWAKFVKMIVYKAVWYKREVKVVDTYYPSSQICFNCKRKKKMSLDCRTYRCEECGYEACRDVNAAKNILFAATGHEVCGRKRSGMEGRRAGSC